VLLKGGAERPVRADASSDLSATLSNTAREGGVWREERLEVLAVKHANPAPLHPLEGHPSGVIDPALTLLERANVPLKL
jgi:hypothetical protein